MAKSKEVAVKENTDVAALAGLDWGVMEVETDSQRLPGIHLISSSSKLAKDGSVPAGTFVNMSTKEQLGKELTVIPFYYGRVWRRSNADDKLVQVVKAESKYDYKFNAAEDPDGLSNKYCFDFYCYVPAHPDIPFVVTFSSTNSDEGRKLAGVMAQGGQIPCRKAVTLTSFMKKGRNGREWMAKNFKVERDSTVDEMKKCHEWARETVEYHAGTFFDKTNEPAEQQNMNF
jgi:hypothetical protein